MAKTEEAEDLDAVVADEDTKGEETGATDDEAAEGETGEETGDEGEEAAEGSEEEPEEPGDLDDTSLFRMEADMLRRENARLREVHDRLSGKYGKIKARMDRLERNAGVEPEPDEPDSTVQDEIKALREDRVQSIRTEIVTEFAAEHADVADPKVLRPVQEWLASHPSPADEYLRRGDLAGARLAARAHLTEAYLSVKRAQARDRVATAGARNNNEQERIRREKRLAVPAGTGRASGAAPNRPKRPEEMTREELHQHFKAQGRAGFGPRKR